MNLKLPKRTEQIDAKREKLLGYDTQGGPIWTEASSHLLTGDQKHELSHNLAAQRRHAAVSKVVQGVLRGAASFFEHSVMEHAPMGVDNETAFSAWLVGSGFAFKQDGLKSVLLHKGKEVGSMTAKCDPSLEADVLIMLKFEHTMAKGLS